MKLHVVKASKVEEHALVKISFCNGLTKGFMDCLNTENKRYQHNIVCDWYIMHKNKSFPSIVHARICIQTFKDAAIAFYALGNNHLEPSSLVLSKYQQKRFFTGTITSHITAFEEKNFMKFCN